jgi:hypothetical protein
MPSFLAQIQKWAYLVEGKKPISIGNFHARQNKNFGKEVCLDSVRISQIVWLSRLMHIWFASSHEQDDVMDMCL